MTTSGVHTSYDLLLVAIGARPRPQLPGAITFGGAADAPAVRRLLDDAAGRLRPRIVFAVGPAMSWPLPMYELALLTSGELRARGVRCEITLVTPEAVPLELFGARASAFVAELLADYDVTFVTNAEPLVAELLADYDVTFVTNAEPLAVTEGELRLVDGRSVGAEHVVALPRAGARDPPHGRRRPGPRGRRRGPRARPAHPVVSDGEPRSSG